MTKTTTGTVVALRNQIAQVSFTNGNLPKLHSLLTLSEDQSSQLEVFGFSEATVADCLILTQNNALKIGASVKDTGKLSSIPVGKNVLGRVINSLGEIEDGQAFTAEDSRPLYGSPDTPTTHLKNIQIPTEILETGIKAIDFFAPLLKGGKLGLFGGAGLGKTMLLTELMHNIVIRHSNDQSKRVALFTAVGERIREAQELVVNLKEADALKNAVIVMGQMGENPALRFRTAAAGVALAEYFRDEQESDVLFFVDNMYRYSQAGYEIATQQSLIPSEDGYQPNLPTQIGTIHQRLASTHKHSITTIEAVYLPSDDITDYSVRSIMPYLDSIIVLSREVYQEGRLPAIDLLSSSSSAMRPDYVSKKHSLAYQKARQLLEHSVRLERIVSLVGMNELSPENKTIYKRAQLLKNYMTQPFVVIEKQGGVPGEFVPLAQTIADVMHIVDGKVDDYDPEKIRMIGALT